LRRRMKPTSTGYRLVKDTQTNKDIQLLKDADRAIRETSTPKLRRAALEYLWDKYVTHADKLSAS
jgi:hypothetical protein